MLIGAHVSISGGIDQAINNGDKIGAECIQTFASSPRTLAFNPIDPKIVELYLNKKSASNIEAHLFHGIYLINLASDNPFLVTKAIESLIGYQQLAGAIGGLGTVFHVGSHKGKGLDSVIDQVGQSIVSVLAKTPANVHLMLENAAGHAGTIGQTLDELAQIFAKVKDLGGDHQKLAICLDSQHAFASGYDFRNVTEVDRLIQEVDSLFGLDKLKAMHLNDSLPEFDSHKDRHANIGEGQIGTEGISHIINHPQLKHLPFFLEVPGENKSGPRKQDIQALKNLVKA